MTAELRHDGKTKITTFSFKELLEELQPYIQQGYILSFENDDWPISYSGCFECVVFPDGATQTENKQEDQQTQETPTNDVKTDGEPVKTPATKSQKPRGRAKQPNPTA